MQDAALEDQPSGILRESSFYLYLKGREVTKPRMKYLGISVARLKRKTVHIKEALNAASGGKLIMARLRPKVLVVDDDAATRDGLTVLLESWGYHALAVANGQAASAKV